MTAKREDPWQRVTVGGMHCVVLDGRVWACCPVAGPDCARLAIDFGDSQWAADVMDVHVELAHSFWR